MATYVKYFEEFCRIEGLPYDLQAIAAHFGWTPESGEDARIYLEDNDISPDDMVAALRRSSGDKVNWIEEGF